MYNKATPAFANTTKIPNVENVSNAEIFWIKEAQVLIDEKLKKGELKRLVSQIRDDGIIVVGGRYAKLYDVSLFDNELVILPYSHRFTKLFVEYMHNRDHLSASATACKIREKYWIIGLMRMLYSI